ncbi:MAG: methylmalonyl Co-A mutase-associated GTPase MeaB [bacterium]|nr:MAG: methylmalonyl Co-A mutase-associated GTPase MeaB [bacterium]
MSRLDDLIADAARRDPRALGRLSRIIDDDLEGKEEALRRLHSMGGDARVVGITGPPGAGKSTLVSNLIREGRAGGLSVAVLAVDPTSPFSGGAVLGDRVRMQEHATDPGVFIRSLATRGHMGGLSRSAQQLLTLLDAAGFDLILLETVGVGQEEVQVKDLAQTVIFVTVPGLGDGIQAMKAGVLEIAHIYLVNKADLPMAETAVKDLQTLVSFSPNEDGWKPPVLTSVATRGEGTGRIMEEMDRHFSHLKASGGIAEWRRSLALNSVTEAIRGVVDGSLQHLMTAGRKEFSEDIDRVGRREEDPLSVARRWLERLDLSRG